MKALLALAVLTAAPALALQATTTDNLNLRSGPTRTSPVVSVLHKGAKVEVGVCSTYCPVIYQGKRGYIARQYLKITPGNTYTPKIPALPVTNPGTYTNVDGQQIQSPTISSTRPAGASAQCRDGSYSFSTHRRGTCSHHGGVEMWF